MISLKTFKDIERMRVAGSIITEAIMSLKGFIVPGISTADIDVFVEDYIRKNGATPSTKGYRVVGIASPYPCSVCASVNDEVVHGIPSAKRFLKEGDIISVDIMACFEGLHCDACYTYGVGEISQKRQALLDVTKESLELALAQVREGNTIGDIGYAVESYVKPRGYGIVREYSGHGVGKKLHEAPSIPNFGKPRSGITLKRGMTLAIEPMIIAGGERLREGRDGWLVATVDGSDAAHFEKTVLVTEDGADILTPWF